MAGQGVPRGGSGPPPPVSLGPSPLAPVAFGVSRARVTSEGRLASPRLPGCCRRHDNRGEARALQASSVILRLQRPPPRPARVRAPRCGRAVPGPSRPPRPAPRGRSPRLPGGSSRKGPAGKKRLCPNRFFPVPFPDRGRVRARRRDRIGVNAKALGLPAAPRGRPRPPGIPGVAGAAGTARITRAPASGPRGGEGLGRPAWPGLARSPSPSAGQTRTCSEAPAGTPPSRRVRRAGGPGWGLQSWRSSWRQPAQTGHGTCP